MRLSSSRRPGARAPLTWAEFSALPDEAVIRREDVAALLQISPRQAGRLGLPVVRCGDVKCVRFSVGGLRHWLAAQQRGAVA